MVRRGFGFLLVAGVLIAVNSASAMWVKLSDAELVAQSDLIVTGTFKGRSEAAGQDLGAIEIRSTLKGAAGGEVAYIVIPAVGKPVSSSDMLFRPGQEGLWFLRLRNLSKPGIYLADHPQRFVPANQAGPAIESVRKSLRP